MTWEHLKSEYKTGNKVLNYCCLCFSFILASLVMSFKPFGSVKVEWPGKADGRHLHHPPKGKWIFLLMHWLLNINAGQYFCSAQLVYNL